MPLRKKYVWPILLLAPLVLLAAIDDNPASPPKGADPVASYASGIIGTKHDFTGGGQAERGLCLPCHTPHITSAEAPLLTQRGGPVRPFPGVDVELDASSLLCLSCHDGLLAPDVFAGSHAATGLPPAEAGGPRRSLRNHPLGVRYPDGDAKYQPRTFAEAEGGIKLPGGRVQCVSCHDPHNTARHAGMLIRSNERSRLCLSCHRL